MEFWGVEVKAKQSLKVKPDAGKLIHISQAAIGELKDVKGPKNVPLRMMTDDQYYIIGNLSIEDRPHLMFDLVFKNDFVLSHGLEKGSVYFMGYIADDPVSEDDAFFDDDGEGTDYSHLLQAPEFGEESSDEEAVPIERKENGTIKVKAEDVKPKVKAEDVKPKVKAEDVKPAAGKEKKEEKVAKKEVEEDSDDDEDDSDFDSDDEMAVDGLEVDSSDISGDDSDEEGEDEELPKELPKGKQAKKRQAESAEKTPAAKKAKAATPENTGKKGQNPTPGPSKSAGKMPNKPNQQTPKSGGQASGKPFTKPISSGKGKHGRK